MPRKKKTHKKRKTKVKTNKRKNVAGQNINRYNCGQDHVIGINACLASICMGARVIEFHFTDNKNRKFRDHQLSLDKSDVIKMIKTGNNFNRLLGNYEKEINKKVLLDKKTLSKGIIANKYLKVGHRIKIDDLNFARPAKYFYANEVKKILNRKVKNNIELGSLIKKSTFE